MLTAQQAQEKLAGVISASKDATAKWVKETCAFIEGNIEAAINGGKDSVFVTVATLSNTKTYVEDPTNQIYALADAIRKAGYTIDYSCSKSSHYNLTISWTANKERVTR